MNTCTPLLIKFKDSRGLFMPSAFDSPFVLGVPSTLLTFGYWVWPPSGRMAWEFKNVPAAIYMNRPAWFGHTCSPPVQPMEKSAAISGGDNHQIAREGRGGGPGGSGPGSGMAGQTAGPEASETIPTQPQSR